MNPVHRFREWRSGLRFGLKAADIRFGGQSVGLAFGSLVSDRIGTAIFIGGLTAFAALPAIVRQTLRVSGGEA